MLFYHQGAVDPVRKSFISMFAKRIRDQIDQKKQTKLFSIVYFFCPLLFLLTLVLHTFGIYTAAAVFGSWIGICISGVALYAFLFLQDVRVTKECIEGIYAFHPEIQSPRAGARGLCAET